MRCLILSLYLYLRSGLKPLFFFFFFQIPIFWHDCTSTCTLLVHFSLSTYRISCLTDPFRQVVRCRRYHNRSTPTSTELDMGLGKGWMSTFCKRFFRLVSSKAL
ncbi:hypothetical protein HOY82DRAFT_230619 [Tuber indicum]|nr:hypothetical protein HOY82DRAFT_230619 [Tuber indicum]